MTRQYYPQQPGYYPPPPPQQNPEGDYDEYEIEEHRGNGGDSWPLRCGIFAGGGCVSFLILVVCCFLMAGLWVLDPGKGMFGPSCSGLEVGVEETAPATATDAVVSDTCLRLSLVAVNRNAASDRIEPQEGSEIIVVSVQLENLSDTEQHYDDWAQFNLINQQGQAYRLSTGTIDEELSVGDLPPKEGKQGRLLFLVQANEPGLILEWLPEDSTTARYISLQ